MELNTTYSNKLRKELMKFVMGEVGMYVVNELVFTTDSNQILNMYFRQSDIENFFK